MDASQIPQQLIEFVKFAAIIGLIATTTVVINLSNTAFRNVFRERTKTYWWLFATLTVIPLLVFLYIFSLLFKK